MLQKINQLDAAWTARLRLVSEQSPVWKPAVWIAHTGDSWVLATIWALVWLLTRGPWHTLAGVLEISIVIQSLFVFGLKKLIRRPRPAGTWGGIYRTYDPHSFPSGHATRAALLALMTLVLAPAWLGLAAAVWAPLVCMARVLTGVHYVSDIAGGLVLGALLGALFVFASPLWQQWLPFLF